jgi:alpha-beta hydrolase superfamily lysophospholipase
MNRSWDRDQAMGFARIRSIGFAALVAVLSASCKPAESPKPRVAADASANSSATKGPATAGPRSALTIRAPDAFYDPPQKLPDRPGMLVRSEPLEGVTLPDGMQGWRILYTTTVDDSTPATAVATVFAPARLPAGQRPVIPWEHGPVGLLQKCMPSLVSDPTVGIPARDRIVPQGWVVVATDYSFVEPNGAHPYLIGEGEARAALDSVRAARQMPELELDSRTVVWGHSEGGHGARWTGTIGPRYAPEVEIAGVAAIAPAADVKNILSLNLAVDKGLGPYLARAYSRFYPDINFEQAVRPEAFEAAKRMADLCAFLPPEDPLKLAAYSEKFYGPALATETNEALATRLEQNTANGRIAAPLVIAQGLVDKIVPPPATDAFVDGRCKAGQPLEYWTAVRSDHESIVAPGSPLEEPLISWTAARFAGEPEAGRCSRKSL